MRKNFRFIAISVILCAGFLMISCKNSNKASKTTGWYYNDPNYGNFSVTEAADERIGPGLVPIEGGAFTMGNTQENVYYTWDNSARNVTVSSFYMDETEVRNIDYLEYIYWLQKIYGTDYPMIVKEALPDTLVWRSSLSYNEPMVEVYLRHPAYHEYPVVGVSWLQANDYAMWRSDRVNEHILISEGVLSFDSDQTADSHFSTDAYLAGQYSGIVNKGIKDYSGKSETGYRNARMEDGFLLPQYRLPTEAEWEYAALALIGNTTEERIVERRVYPWNTDGLRSDEKNYYGTFTANYKRGNGDYMGIAGDLNDGAAFPGPVASYWPNDYGLYNMAGNVSEWVLDVYRPLSFEDVADHNPYRGNVFQNKVVDSIGNITYQEATPESVTARRNYRNSYNVNYNDGDAQSTIQNDWASVNGDQKNFTDQMYEYGVTTLISDKSRVYKGGSWADGPYYLSPSTRRFLEEDQATATIGFRCAMNKIGSALTKSKK